MRGRISERRALFTTTTYFTGLREDYRYMRKGSSQEERGQAVGVVIVRRVEDSGEQQVSLFLLVPTRTGAVHERHTQRFAIEALRDEPDDVQVFLEQYAPEAMQDDVAAI